MLPYFALQALPSVLALARPGRGGRAAMALLVVVFAAAMGLRLEVGADWWQYEALHEAAAGESLGAQLARAEPASHALFWLSARLTGGSLLTNLAAGLILMTGIAALARRTPNPWLAVLAATPYLVIAFGFSGIRQAMGVGACLLVLAHWDRLGTAARGAGMLAASLLHASALVMGIFVVGLMRLPFALRAALVPAAGLAAALLARGAGPYQASFDALGRRYLDDPAAVVSEGSLAHIALVLVPALVALALRRRLAPHVFDPRLLTAGALACLALPALNLVSTTVASRLSLYLYFVPMLAWPALAASLGRRGGRPLVLALVVLHFGILAAWLLFANNAGPHLPYRSLLAAG